MLPPHQRREGSREADDKKPASARLVEACFQLELHHILWRRLRNKWEPKMSPRALCRIPKTRTTALYKYWLLVHLKGRSATLLLPSFA